MLRWLSRGSVVMALGLGLLWLAGTRSALARPDETEVTPLLAQIKKVGKEGTGNEEAAKAWKGLVAHGTAAMIPALGSFDDDNFRANNWLRSAVEAVVEKALADGKGLPAAELEKFISDKSQPPSGRALAFEVLAKADKKAPARLLPDLLHDASPVLRREAVAAAMDKAKGLLAANDKQGATAEYRKAFSGAVDKDQLDAITKELKGLGVTVDLAGHLGMVRHWQVVAPFDNVNGVGFARVYPPEKGVDLKASYKGKDGAEVKWTPASTTDPYGLVNLNKALGEYKGAVAYAQAEIQSPKKQPVEIRIGCITALKVYLNGKELFNCEEYHHGMELDQYKARGELQPGRNELLLKVCQNEQKEKWAQVWHFQARLTDRVGAAIPFSQTPAQKVKP